MSPTRRGAAFGLVAAGGAALSPIGAAAQATPPAPQIEPPDADEPPTDLATGQDHNEHMLAPVTINGQGPFNFLLDTGANASCVSSRLAERLDLKAQSSEPVHTVVGVRDRPIVLLDELQVGPRSRKRVKAPSLPIKGPEVDGVLGVDWLKGQRLVLDFKAKKLEITASHADESEPGHVVVVPARKRHGQLTIVDADMSGVSISAIIDSGAEGTLCNRPLHDVVREREVRRGFNNPPQFLRMETLAGEGFEAETVFLPFLRLGGLRLGNVQVAYADMHVFDIWGLKDKPALVIGMDLLRQFEQVALDFGRSQVRFEFI